MAELTEAGQAIYNEIEQEVKERVFKGGWAPPDKKETSGMSEEEERKYKLKQELTTWWYDQAQKEIGAVVDKAILYGGEDLDVMGQAMLALLKWEDAPIRVGKELACCFYLLGKCARMIGAYADRRVPTDDTWFDAAVYARMTERIRETGTWP